ncbi:MAG: hypothetical protein H7641_00610 [Candidatus Heimdallarchaeota archaeon]|nr:hypothetical protein [Candidatus Heimdallarchaeota archaeon]MCK4876067.1 hypothetical protein [Candidatus Heimdallarchaeota archaeon]
MTSSIEQEIKNIKVRLEELYAISNTILQLLLPEEDAFSDEISAIESDEDIVDEEELFKELTS